MSLIPHLIMQKKFYHSVHKNNHQVKRQYLMLWHELIIHVFFNVWLAGFSVLIYKADPGACRNKIWTISY